ncbi:E3 SUMO-protein ligase ZBED1-like [Prorops nasuta]|uniref:E3 SUMO-protein ligase ZBED1-like n=1 Tax=Prorops nasuta TaxID=863751 RepID=UPI0034CE7D86
MASTSHSSAISMAIDTNDYCDESLVSSPDLQGSNTSNSSKGNEHTVLQPRIDHSYSRIRSFEGNISIYVTMNSTPKNIKTIVSDGGVEASEITNAIMYMIAKDNLPFKTVDKEGFRYLMKVAAPLYNVPGRKPITNKIKEKYNYLSECKKVKLESIDFFSITSDIWTDTLNTVSYIGITIHYEYESEINSTMIGVTELHERHTSDVLGRWIKQIIEDWHILSEKVVAFITDIATNIKKAIKDTFGEKKHIACLAHSVNLVAENILKSPEAMALCAKIKKIVIYFKHLVIAADELRKMNNLKLIQSVETRWNSTNYMLEIYILISKEVSSILLNIPDSPQMITAPELQLANEIMKVLQPLEILTKELCAEKFVTVSKVIPLINCLKSKLETLKESLRTLVAKLLRDCFNESITHKLGQVDNNSIIAISTILDPRFKKLHLKPIPCSSAIVEIFRLMKEFDFDNRVNNEPSQ